MISNVIRQGFDGSQFSIYTAQMDRSNSNRKVLNMLWDSKDFLNGEGDAETQENHHPVLSRIAGVPIAVFDVSLECVRPACLAIESIVFMAISMIATTYHLLHLDWQPTRKNLRITILNLHDAIENTLLVPLRVASSPIVLIGQMIRFMIDPQKTLPTHKLLSSSTSKPGKLYQGMTDEFFDDRQKARFLKINQYASRNESAKRAILGRVYAFSFAVLDPVVGVLKPLIGAVANLALGILFLGVIVVEGPKLPRATLLRGVSLQAMCLRLDIVADMLTKVVLFPITLIAQIGTALRNPRTVAPSTEWLYKSQPGDLRLSIYLEEKQAKVDQRGNDWKLVTEGEDEPRDHQINHLSQQNHSFVGMQSHLGLQSNHWPDMRRNYSEQNRPNWNALFGANLNQQQQYSNQ